MKKIIEFKKNEKVRETKALIGVLIPRLLYNLEIDKLEDWFRKLFKINNAMFISENSDGETQTLIIFKDDIEKCDKDTKLIFTTTGENSGPYCMPIYTLGYILNLNNDDTISDWLENIYETDIFFLPSVEFEAPRPLQKNHLTVDGFRMKYPSTEICHYTELQRLIEIAIKERAVILTKSKIRVKGANIVYPSINTDIWARGYSLCVIDRLEEFDEKILEILLENRVDVIIASSLEL